MKRRNFISGLSVLSAATTLSAASIAETASKKEKVLKIALLVEWLIPGVCACLWFVLFL